MDLTLAAPAAVAFAIGYALGSIPFGLLLTKAAGLGDVRNIGSGNIGATNVLRTGHKGLAALTLLLDALKGTAAVLIAHAFGASHGIAILAGLAGGLGAFLGHIFPVWLGFRGGKGVATYIGILFGLFWPAGLTFCVAWLLAAVLTRISSLSAIAASLIVPPVLYYLDNVPEAGLALIMTSLLIVKHAANIRRLLKGEEPKIGDNKTAPAKGPLNA
jgi:acyl phosphate:glycerol-3-phosphate acyltransferase